MIQQQSDIFMYFKRYNTTAATLYKCSEHFNDYVRTIIKVTNYCVDYLIDEAPFVNMVWLSAKQHLIPETLPKFCKELKLERFTKLVARTMLVYRIKWLNGKLAVKKKFTRGKGKAKRKGKSAMSKSQKKLEKLTHA